MNENLLSTLWDDLWTDLGNPGLRWQVAAILACFLVGWGLARALRAAILAREARNPLVHAGVESFARMLWPLLTLALIALAKILLQRWYAVDLLRLAFALVASFAAVRLGFYFLRRVFARSGRVGIFLLLFERTFALLVWIGVAMHITGLLPDLEHFLDSTLLPLGKNRVPLMTILQAVASVGVTLILALWAGALLEERLMRLDSVHSSLRAVMSRLGRAAMVLVAVLVSLSLVGIDLTVLSVFGGALGVGLGLGLQKIVSSYFSGFVILLERSLAVGDIVTVDKFSGRVTQINTRYTVLRGGDGGETVIPNEMLVSLPVQNYSLTDRTLQVTTQVSVDYRTDIELALRLLEEATHNVARVSREPEHTPHAFMMAFGADGIDLELSFWVLDAENGKNGVRSDVNRAIWRALQAHGISVPYPQREVTLVDRQDVHTNNGTAVTGQP